MAMVTDGLLLVTRQSAMLVGRDGCQELAGQFRLKAGESEQHPSQIQRRHWCRLQKGLVVGVCRYGWGDRRRLMQAICSCPTSHGRRE
jgi:hypothetical protein